MLLCVSLCFEFVRKFGFESTILSKVYFDAVADCLQIKFQFMGKVPISTFDFTVASLYNYKLAYLCQSLILLDIISVSNKTRKFLNQK